MAVSLVNVALNLYYGNGQPIVTGSASLTPGSELQDVPDGMQIVQAPVPAAFAPSGTPVVAIIPTDAAGPQPAGWAWQASFQGVPGTPPPFAFYAPAGPCSFTVTDATPAVFTWTPTAAFTAAALDDLPVGTIITLATLTGGAGFATATPYYVVASSGSTFRLSATAGGSPIASTSAGSGTFTVTQYSLSSLSPLASASGLSIAMPTPSGAATSGQVPVATGTGEASAWTTLTAASVGADASGAASAAQAAAETFATSAAAAAQSAAEAASMPVLAQTAVKTANYTASANQLVPVNTTSGAVTVTLPSAPAAGTVCGVKMVIQGGANAVTVACAGSDVLNKAGGGTTLALSLLNQGALLEYNSGVWLVLSDDLPLSQLEALFLAVPSGAASAGMSPLAAGSGEASAWGFAGAGATVVVPKPAGATATDTPNVTTAITAFTTALASGPATLLFQDGTYQIDSNTAVIRSPNSTTVGSASNTAEPSAWVTGSPGTLTVATGGTAGFPSAGQIWVAASGGTTALVSYTGTTSATFTGCLYLSGSPTGTLSTGGAVTGVLSNFSVRSSGRTIIQQAPNRAGNVNNVTGDLFIIADCTDFTVTPGMVFDGNRDAVAPLTPLTATAASAQPSVTVASGAGAAYLPGQYLAVLGGIGSADSAKSDGLNTGGTSPLVISSITPGGGAGGGDLITFTANLSNTYSVISATILADGYGPYGCSGAFVTPYSCGYGLSVAGRANLGSEDSQNALHLFNCQRFRIEGVTARNTWLSPVKLGCGISPNNSTYANSCYDGIIAGCTLYHGYDQGVSVWICQRITIAGNVIDSPGWGGVVMTESDLCAVTGNEIKNVIYQSAGNAGGGVVVEGGIANVISANVIAAPLLTTAAAGISVQGWASNGKWGLSATSSSWPTLTAAVEAGTTAGTSVALSATGALLVGGRYSIFDGYRTEAVKVATIIDGTHVTFAENIHFTHVSGLYICPRFSQDNVVSGNEISLFPGTTASCDGVYLGGSVRNTISGNVIKDASNNGINLRAASQFCPPSSYNGGDGSMVSGNFVSGCAAFPISLYGTSHITVSGNHVSSNVNSGSLRGIDLAGATDVVVSDNKVCDVTSSDGIRLSQGGPLSVNCARVTIADNLCERTFGNGIVVFGADSVTVRGNICQSNQSWGIALEGAANCRVIDNTANSNNSGGITLANNSGTGCTNCVVAGNTARDDATGLNEHTGASYTQPHGIVESGNSDFNVFEANVCNSNGTDQLTMVGAHSAARKNNISGSLIPPSVTTPAMPATTVSQQNTTGHDVLVYLTATTVTQVEVGSTNTGMTGGMIYLAAGQTITLTYATGTPTWVWMAAG